MALFNVRKEGMHAKLATHIAYVSHLCLLFVPQIFSLLQPALFISMYYTHFYLKLKGELLVTKYKSKTNPPKTPLNQGRCLKQILYTKR